jgi:hypothetical protein
MMTNRQIKGKRIVQRRRGGQLLKKKEWDGIEKDVYKEYLSTGNVKSSPIRTRVARNSKQKDLVKMNPEEEKAKVVVQQENLKINPEEDNNKVVVQQENLKITP